MIDLIKDNTIEFSSKVLSFLSRVVMSVYFYNQFILKIFDIYKKYV